MKKMYCKDKEFECQCGAKIPMSQLIADGEFDSTSFKENSVPEWFNPFDKDGKRSIGEDRISLPFNCHCPKCDRLYIAYLVCSIFAYDIYDDDCNVVASEYTEPVSQNKVIS